MTFHHKIPRNIRKNKEEDIHIPKLSEKSITIPLYIPISHNLSEPNMKYTYLHFPQESKKYIDKVMGSSSLVLNSHELSSSIGQNMWYFLWDFMGILMTFGFVELGCSPPCSSLIGKQWKHLWKKIWNNICGSSSLFYTCHEFSWFWMDSFVMVLELGCSPPCSGKDGTILEKI